MSKSVVGFLKLFRPSNAPTVVSNVLIVTLFTLPALPQPSVGIEFSWSLIALILAGVLAYSFGMAVNDLFDFNHDKIAKPFRPLVAGLVSKKSAWLAAAIVFLTSLFLYWLVYRLHYSSFALTSVLLLFAVIVLYNVFHKKIKFAELLMGYCRFMLILTTHLLLSEVFNPRVLVYGAIVFAHTVMITWFAKKGFFKEIKAINSIAYLIAGFCLIDLAVASALGNFELGVLCLSMFFLTILLQPLARGT
jgi:4-hydroxybenzoate polyprenyltransferase